MALTTNKLSAYKSRRAQGLCGFCGAQPLTNRLICQICVTKRSKIRTVRLKLRNIERKLAKLCVQCGDSTDNGIRCVKCVTVKNKRQQECTLIRTNSGLRRDDLRFKSCSNCRINDAKSSMMFRSKNSSYSRNYMKTIVIEALNHYGGQICNCCGEKNTYFLSIDHINNNGADHRREIGCVTGKNLARWLKKIGWPSGYQIMCFNCNCGRAKNKGVCPHNEDMANGSCNR